MTPPNTSKIQRRAFLKTAGIGVGLAAVNPAPGAPPSVAVIVDPIDTVANAGPSKWAVQELQIRLQKWKIDSRIIPSISQAAPGETCVIASGPLLTPPAVMPAASRPPVAAESFTLSMATLGGHRTVIAAGHDPRGLVYALLELADRVDYEATPMAAFQIGKAITEQPANKVRSVLKAFVSEVEDKSWYYDRGAWQDYLTMLATHRFNRFNLSFGIGYDFVNEIRDSYFHFAYPFLLNVPGYNVQISITPADSRVKPQMLSNDERARNLDLLKFIGNAAQERGMDFQLGIWTHAWNFDGAPDPSHRIIGLTPANHAAYCRDALQALLVACPSITGVTLRTHGESGVPEQSYPFWKTVFAGIAAVGRPIEIDQHAKGIDAEMIALAKATGMPTAVSPKFWAEHMGLPYHQAAIRPTEMPKTAPGTDAKGALMSLSNGSRNFLRYGYGDLLREDRKYSVLHRIWPGTQRFLLWGDPLMAAGYGRASGFSGSEGVEWMEPLSFKGRKGSGLAGGRTGYAGLRPQGERDWDKYLYTYRVWGRAIYNPSASADPRKRYLRKALGVAADSGEAALALSSRILPMVTTAHMPSAANANYWPEIYTNQSIVNAGSADPYSDTPAPKRFGTVSPLDPRLFSTIDQCAEAILSGAQDSRYSPVEVATWLEELARDSDTNLGAAESVAVPGRRTSEFQQWSTDITILNGLGRFFAAKFRAGVLFAIYSRTADPAAQEEALKACRKARDAWKDICDISFNVYRPDLTYGYLPHLRGRWHDRLAAIDQDIADMEKFTPSVPATVATSAIVAALSTPQHPTVLVQHTAPKKFRAAIPIVLEASLPAATPGKLNLCYRRVNQAEPWVTLPMEPVATGFRAAIPSDYAASPFPLQYYFEAKLESGVSTVYPGLTKDYSTQPYFLIRKG